MNMNLHMSSNLMYELTVNFFQVSMTSKEKNVTSTHSKPSTTASCSPIPLDHEDQRDEESSPAGADIH